MNWKNINKMAVNTANNETETINFEVSEDGQYFRITNEYGNHSISFDLMTGFEAINRIQESYKSYIDTEIQNDFRNQNMSNLADYVDAPHTDDDCEGI